jgi:hypothetical protein
MAQPRAKTKAITEFGDFQTPAALALAVTEKLRDLGLRPHALLEPTCGKGAFVMAAADTFKDAKTIIGVEINPAYVETAVATLSARNDAQKIRVETGDFFGFEWPKIMESDAGPWLIIGNPPWVTSSSLGALSSTNLPDKSNFHGRAGIEAVTGKSNFDISEWMLLRYLDWLKGSGTIAVLCKTSVARKILSHVWKQSGVLFGHIYMIDAMAHFGAAVDACLFVLGLVPEASCTTCEIYDSLDDAKPSSTVAYCKGHLVADTTPALLEVLWGPETNYIWRSGIKHDCARVMELFLEPGGYVNGLGETVEVEETFLYPMLKGSDIGNGRIRPRAKMIVTQETVGQQTAGIALAAPNTWAYLTRHEAYLNKRGSVIYRNKPDFSIFGVGSYTFAPWKLAVSSFYKKLLFVSVGPIEGRTMVFDDTVYFLPCGSEREARFLEEILHSDLATQFLNSMVHWADKRPLTVDLLKRLSIRKLAAALGRSAEYEMFTRPVIIEEKQSALSFA